MTPIESKRLIATFMNYAGGKPLTDELLLTLYNDWNSIMPVVDKIEDIIVDGDNSFNVWCYTKEAIISTNVNVEYKCLFNHKCFCGVPNRLFCIARVTCWCG